MGSKSRRYCDLRCVHASAPKAAMDGARSCMTFNAIWCSLHERHVMKSQPCGDREERERGEVARKE